MSLERFQNRLCGMALVNEERQGRNRNMSLFGFACPIQEGRGQALSRAAHCESDKKASCVATHTWGLWKNNVLASQLLP